MQVLALLWMASAILFLAAGLFIIAVGDFSFGIKYVLGGLAMLGLNHWVERNSKKAKEKERKEQKERAVREKLEQVKKQEHIAELNQIVKQGKWIFPAEKFYQQCIDSHVATLENEFSIRKATQIAERLIKETTPEIDLANCKEYLKKESLEGFLKNGEILARETEARNKLPRNANPNEPEKTFIQRASALLWLSGCAKRVGMLTNLIGDYDDKINTMREGEEALKQLGMIYASQQKKETDWSVMGGIAEGIAGPAAGVMVASNTIANNRRIQQYNESVRKASMDIMSGIPNMAGDRYKLEEERAQIIKKLDEAKSKVTISKPTAEEIWKNIKVGKAEVKKNPSGVLSVSVPVSLKEPFALDVPDNVRMVVDGTIKGEVWFENKLVGEVFFPLPLYGIPSNMTATVTLDGMCGRSVEYNGEYTVKIANTHNLWIMEA